MSLVLFPISIIIAFFLGGQFLSSPNVQSEQELSEEEKQKRFSKRFSSGERTIFEAINEANYNDDLVSCNQDFKDQKYSEAAECLKKLVKDYPNEPEALIYYNNALSRKFALSPQYANPQVQVVIVSADQGKRAKDMLRGVAQAQDQFNKNQFSPEPTLRFLETIIVYDSNDPEISRKIAREIIENKSILGVIGNLSKEALEVYEAANLAMISPRNTSTELKSKILFRTIDYKILSKKLAEYVKQLGVEKVVIFYNNKSSSSKSLKEYFRFYFDSSKSVREVDLTQQFLDSEVQSAIEEKFKVGILFPDLETVDSAVKIAQKNYQKSKEQQLKLLGSNDLYYCNVLKKGEQAVKGLILAVPWFKGTPEAKKFSTEVEKQWGGEVSWLTAASYDATQVLISALSDSGENPSRSKVLEKVKEVNLPADKTSGEDLRFSPEGERKGKAILVEVVESSSNPGCSNLDFRQLKVDVPPTN